MAGKICGVYMISIKTDCGREYLYVGQSMDCQKRFLQHERSIRKGNHKNKKMQNVFNKYKNIEFEILEVCLEELLCEYESWWLNEMYGKEFCMNLAFDSEVPARGLRRSQESKLKMSKAKKGSNHPNWGKPLPSSTKSKISVAQKGVPRPESSVQNMRKPKKEGFREMRAKMASGVKQSPETIEKRVSKLRGVPRSEEYKARLRIKLNSPEVKAKREKTFKERKENGKRSKTNN